MINKTNYSELVKQAILAYLDKGYMDKNIIFTKIVEDLGVPRPTVRRIARDLRNEMLNKVKILQSDVINEKHFG